VKSYDAQVAFAQIDFSVITYCSVLLFNVHLSNDLFSGHFQLHCCDWLIVTDDRLSCIILVCRSQRKLTKQDSTLQYLHCWSLWMLHTSWRQTSQKKKKPKKINQRPKKETSQIWLATWEDIFGDEETSQSRNNMPFIKYFIMICFFFIPVLETTSQNWLYWIMPCPKRNAFI